MRKLAMLLAIAAVVCGYAGYPYLTLKRIERAALARDEGTVNALIDWPRVREGLKSDVQSAMIDTKLKNSGEAAGALGTMLAATMIDKMLDSIIGPEVIYKQLEERKATDKPLSSYLAGTRFVSPTIFQADFRPDETKAFTATVTLEFAALTWKITRVSVPLRELMSDSASDEYLKKRFKPADQ